MEKQKVFATVAGREILQSDIELLKRNLDPKMVTELNSDEGNHRLISELVNQELFYLEAVESKIENDPIFQSELAKLKSNLLKQYAVDKILCAISVTEGEMLNYYNENKSQFAEQESVKASHILVDVEVKAAKIIEELNAGLSFEDAAQKYSSCPSKSQGGDLGYFKRGNMVPEFESAAFELKIDEISSPVKTQFGYHIIKLIDKKKSPIKPYDEVKNNISKQLVLKKQQDVYFKKIDELKNKYEVKFIED